ncbi:copper amine oxidase N-terminal domain-containing protein [Candidatus Formimonas warabiya]|uniref:Copper amine oxidase-like N-terminal domain-containing protein n=1 Tax=Formimonas warabiya TaxID=1761012 RepID=A0A3G1KWQ1_FORW1|nr:copper amine oxidase N-terminal domain-containing protein [Candidatus Formimonas warabiya]ATW26904.1 hypothetical protein DCMF_20985 [Candidatus Formimonas warabiya]
MNKRFAALVVLGVFLGGITVGVLAASPIRIMVNGVEVKSDVNPQIIKGRTMVPLRTVAEALGNEVKWDGKTQEVKIDSGDNVWEEPFDPWKNLDDYRAVSVVSQYLSLLQGAVWGGDLDSYPFLFSKAVREAAEPWNRVWQPSMSGRVGSSVCRLSFQVLDGHVAGKDAQGYPVYEVAARLNYYDPGAGEPVLKEWVKVYTVISEVSPDQNGINGNHMVIDGEKTMKEVPHKSNQMPSFWN